MAARGSWPRSLRVRWMDMRTAWVAALRSLRLHWLFLRRMTAGRTWRSAKLLSQSASGRSRNVKRLSCQRCRRAARRRGRRRPRPIGPHRGRASGQTLGQPAAQRGIDDLAPMPPVYHHPDQGASRIVFGSCRYGRLKRYASGCRKHNNHRIGGRSQARNYKSALGKYLAISLVVVVHGVGCHLPLNQCHKMAPFGI